MKRILLSLTILLVLPSVVCAENHYVTQSGGGDGSSPSNPWSVDGFNDPGNWNSAVDSDDGYIGPGDTVYFSGTITTPMKIRSGGSPGKYITFDGWEGGYCHPVEDGGCGGNAALISTPYAYSSMESYAGFFIGEMGTFPANVDNLIFQDFEMTGSRGIFCPGTSNPSVDNIQNIIVRRNHIHDTYQGGVSFKNSAGGSPAPVYTNITIGGAQGQGNLFHNIRKERFEAAWHSFDSVEGLIVSYNEFGSDAFYQGGQNALAIFTSNGILVEYNEFYKCPQGCVVPKEPFNDNMIIRFNKFHDNIMSISISRNSNNMVIYGNYDNNSAHSMRFGKGSKNIYAWANIIDNDAERAFSSYLVTEAEWGCDHCYFVNNVVANAGINENEQDKTGVFLSAIGPNGFVLTNNILLNNGRGSPGYEQMFLKGADKSRLTLEHNQYYDERGTVKWVWDSQGNPRDLAYLQSEGHEDDITPNSPGGQIGDPGLKPDFTVIDNDSAVVDTGFTMSNSVLPTIIVQDVPYGPDQFGDKYYGFDVALHPSTDLNPFPLPSSIITVSQNDYGLGWERGAYVYIGDEPQDTCSFLNGYCCILPDTCPGTDLGTYTDCSGTCCSEPCQAPTEDTCTGLGYRCCTSCEPGTEHPENDTDCPVVCCGTCLSQPIQGDYNYSIIKTPYLPVIDADLSEFSDADTVTVTDPTTGTTGTYRLMWDDSALYIAAEFSDTALNTDPAHADDDELWRDDSLEIMFDTLNDGGDTSPHIDDYKFYAIPSGAYADSQAYNMDWDSGLSHDVSVQGTINQNTDTDNGWVVEMSLPWPEWGITEPVFGSVWGMNIQLNDMTATDKYSTQWSGSGLSVNVPDGWNDVLFTVRADSSRDGCMDMNELVPFIDSWKYDSTGYPMREMMEAVVLYYSPGDWC